MLKEMKTDAMPSVGNWFSATMKSIACSVGQRRALPALHRTRRFQVALRSQQLTLPQQPQWLATTIVLQRKLDAPVLVEAQIVSLAARLALALAQLIALLCQKR